MAKLPSYNLFIQKALELGALESKIIKAKSIVTAPWVRLRCQFGSSGYNTSLCCPPYSPTPEEIRKVIDCYTKAILIHVIKLGKITKIISQLERKYFFLDIIKPSDSAPGHVQFARTAIKLHVSIQRKQDLLWKHVELMFMLQFGLTDTRLR